MAIELERLIATLEANMKTYDKAMKKALGDTDRTFKKIETRGAQLENRLAKLGRGAFDGFTRGAIGALVPAISAAAAIQKTKQALQEFGDIADNAAAAGVDAELFQGLAHHAELAGVSMESFSTSLADFAKNSALAVEGKGRMVTALKALNPQLLENIRSAKSQEERIRLVADALAAETDASRRAAIAQATLGDAGKLLANAFANGSATINETMQKARDLGLIVDRELIARAEQLGDEFDTTTKVIDLQLKQALVNLGPILVWLSGLAADFGETIGFVVDGTRSLEDQNLQTVVKQYRALADAKKAGFGGIGIFGDMQDAEMRKLAAEIFRRGDRQSIEKLQATNAPETPALPTLDEIDTRNEAAKAAIKQADAVKELIAGLQFESDLIGKSAVDQEVARNLRQAGATATAEQRQRIEELVRANYAEEKQVQALQDAYEELGNIGESAVNRLVDAMEDGKIEGQELLSIAGDIAKQLGGMFIKNAFNGLGGGGFNLGSLFSFAGGGHTPNTARSGGLDGQGGFLAMLHPRETVVDHARPSTSAAPAGGGGNTFYIDARGAQLGVGEEIVRALDRYSRLTLPGRVKQINADPYAVG